GLPKRPCSRLANLRARRDISLSVPSMFSGKPTTKASGCHSSTSCATAFQSGIPSRAGKGFNGEPRPVRFCPTATPIRFTPKSNPNTRITCHFVVNLCTRPTRQLMGAQPHVKPALGGLDSSGMARLAAQTMEIHPEAGQGRMKPLGVRGVEQNFLRGRAGQPVVDGNLLLQLTSPPTGVAQRHQLLLRCIGAGE